MSGRAVLAVVTLLVLLAGCGTPQPPVLPGATPQPPASRSPLPPPPALVNPGHLTIGADYHFAPQSYIDAAGHAAGFDVDLAGAVASEMRLKLTVLNIDDPSIISGLMQQAHRYDMGVNQPVSAVSGAGAVGLPYLESGQSILVRAGDRRIKDLGSACGLTVGAAPSSQAELALVGVNDAACHDHKARLVAAPDDVAAARDVASGKLDALVDDYPAAVLLARTTPGTRVVAHHFLPVQVELVFPAGGESARDAVSRAFDRLRKNGTYQRLLDKWGLGEGALH
ncbi:MAG: transporter substrate-binding domain-containing protein [Candidatus Dormibacteraeota bacterium]|nr:transporter substrate-binding domain-containing protein [Candidatus Dormibacteraeota bacterium]